MMFRISLRELFVLVAAIALAIVSLKYASLVWQTIVGLIAMLTAIVVVMTGLFDRGPRQAFAIGFAVAMFGYLLLVANGQKYDRGRLKLNVEIGELFQGQLPTSHLLGYVHKAFYHAGYVDPITGKDLTDVDPKKNPNISVDSNGNALIGGLPVMWQVRPSAGNFLPIGHYWWALLFGYIGGRFARFVYVRRTKNQQTAM